MTSASGPKHEHERVAYVFEAFRFDAAQRALFRAGARVRITPKTADLLLALLENHGRTLTKTELIQRVWPDTFVEEGNLTFQMHLLRQALSDSVEQSVYVQTIPRRGYRFMCPITVEAIDLDEGVQHSIPE